MYTLPVLSLTLKLAHSLVDTCLTIVYCPNCLPHLIQLFTSISYLPLLYDSNVNVKYKWLQKLLVTSLQLLVHSSFQVSYHNIICLLYTKNCWCQDGWRDINSLTIMKTTHHQQFCFVCFCLVQRR